MQLVTDDRNLPAFQVTCPTGARCLFRQDLHSGMYVLNLNDVRATFITVFVHRDQ